MPQEDKEQRADETPHSPPEESQIPAIQEEQPKPTKEEKERELESFLEDMPPEVRKSVSMMMSQTFARVPFLHPILEKITSNHIDQFIDGSRRESEIDYQLRSTNRWFYLLTFLILVGVFIFMILYLLPAHTDLLTKLLELLGAFAGGIGAGFGAKVFLDRKG